MKICAARRCPKHLGHSGLSILLATAAISLTTAGGCSTTDAQPQPNRPPPVKLEGSRWAVVALRGQYPQGDVQLVLELGPEGRVSGFAGVNRFNGSYTLKQQAEGRGTLSFGELATTRMAGPPELMQQEERFLAALKTVDGYRAEGGLMELEAGGAPVLRFRQLAAR